MWVCINRKIRSSRMRVCAYWTTLCKQVFWDDSTTTILMRIRPDSLRREGSVCVRARAHTEYGHVKQTRCWGCVGQAQKHAHTLSCANVPAFCINYQYFKIFSISNCRRTTQRTVTQVRWHHAKENNGRDARGCLFDDWWCQATQLFFIGLCAECGVRADSTGLWLGDNFVDAFSLHIWLELEDRIDTKKLLSFANVIVVIFCLTMYICVLHIL